MCGRVRVVVMFHVEQFRGGLRHLLLVLVVLLNHVFALLVAVLALTCHVGIACIVVRATVVALKQVRVIVLQRFICVPQCAHVLVLNPTIGSTRYAQLCDEKRWVYVVSVAVRVPVLVTDVHAFQFH